jgi:hypothetical protein
MPDKVLALKRIESKSSTPPRSLLNKKELDVLERV